MPIRFEDLRSTINMVLERTESLLRILLFIVVVVN